MEHRHSFTPPASSCSGYSPMVASQTWKNRRTHRGVFQVNTSWGVVFGVFGRFFGGFKRRTSGGVWRSKGYNKHRKLQKWWAIRVTAAPATWWISSVPCYFVQQQVNKQLTRRAEIILGSFSKTELILFKAKSQYFYLCNPEIMGNFKGGRPNATFREMGLYSSKGLLYHHDCPFIIS